MNKISIDDLIEDYRIKHQDHVKKCRHFQQRYKEGWIFVANSSYALALGGSFPDNYNKLSRLIVNTLSEKSTFIYSEHLPLDQMSVRISINQISDKESKLDSLKRLIPQILSGSISVMVDRNTYSLENHRDLENQIGWYVKVSR